MYEERNDFRLRDILIQLFFVALFIFLMIWLFPTKSYLEDNYVDNDEMVNIDIDGALKESLQVLYGRVFADNVDSMRVAATNYFTKERLPEKVGDSVTLTLGEMLDKKLVLEFKDSNNKYCDTTESYVKLTKMDSEYQLKVQLTCSDYSDYIISHLGCYEYCEDCKDEVVVNTTKPSTKPTTPTKKPTTQKEETKPTPVAKTYLYEYRKTWQNEWSDWSNWSNWSETKKTTDNNTQVEIKKEQVLTGYEQIKKITGYEQVWAVTGYDEVKTTKQDVKNADVVSSSGYYTDWYSAGTTTARNGYKYNTTTTQYTLLKTDYVLDCNNVCEYVTVRTYSVKKRDYVQGGSSYSCSKYPGYRLSGSKCVKTIETTEKEPIYGYVNGDPIYKYVNGDPIYKSVTKYRYRTRTLVKEAGSSTKWSKSTSDKTLLNDGYKLTGNKKEA